MLQSQPYKDHVECTALEPTQYPVWWLSQVIDHASCSLTALTIKLRSPECTDVLAAQPGAGSTNIYRITCAHMYSLFWIAKVLCELEAIGTCMLARETWWLILGATGRS